MTLTSDHASPVAAGTVVKLTAKVTISTGAPPVGKVVFTDYAGTHPAALGEVYLDQDGEPPRKKCELAPQRRAPRHRREICR